MPNGCRPGKTQMPLPLQDYSQPSGQYPRRRQSHLLPCQDHGFNRSPGLDFTNASIQLINEIPVQCVQCFRTTDGNHRNRILIAHRDSHSLTPSVCSHRSPCRTSVHIRPLHSVLSGKRQANPLYRRGAEALHVDIVFQVQASHIQRLQRTHGMAQRPLDSCINGLWRCNAGINKIAGLPGQGS